MIFNNDEKVQNTRSRGDCSEFRRIESLERYTSQRVRRVSPHNSDVMETLSCTTIMLRPSCFVRYVDHSLLHDV